MMTTLVLVGAGASKYSGENTVRPDMPPLGKNLFSELEDFHDVFRNIAPDIKEALKADFEGGMEELMAAVGHKIEPEFLYQLGLYFCRFELSANPVLCRSNLYVRLLKGLRDRNHKVVCASLNYECLFELALLQAGYHAFWYGEPDDGNDNNSPPVIKPHGSANWLPHRAEGFGNANFLFSGAVPYLTNAQVDRLLPDKALLMLSQNANSLCLPIISRYMEGKKTMVCPEDTEQERQRFCSAVAGAKRILVVGVAVVEADTHIWGALQQATGTIGYVSPEEEYFLKWKKQHDMQQAYPVEARFEDCFSRTGFSDRMISFLEDEISDL